MSFSEFLSFCRHAVKVCSASMKSQAVVNQAAMNELIDIAIRTHRHIQLLGTLDVNETRFKSRMYLHLQYTTIHRVLHVSASAMAVFKDVVDVFMTRLPRSAFSAKISSASPAAAAALYNGIPASPAPKTRRSWTKPKAGCYLCV